MPAMPILDLKPNAALVRLGVAGIGFMDIPTR